MRLMQYLINETSREPIGGERGTTREDFAVLKRITTVAVVATIICAPTVAFAAPTEAPVAPAAAPAPAVAIVPAVAAATTKPTLRVDENADGSLIATITNADSRDVTGTIVLSEPTLGEVARESVSLKPGAKSAVDLGELIDSGDYGVTLTVSAADAKPVVVTAEYTVNIDPIVADESAPEVADAPDAPVKAEPVKAAVKKATPAVKAPAAPAKTLQHVALVAPQAPMYVIAFERASLLAAALLSVSLA